MATALTPVNQWDANMIVPDDGDTRSAASVTAPGVGFQVAANRLLYLRNRLVNAVGGTVRLPMNIKYRNLNAGTPYLDYISAAGGVSGQVSQNDVTASGIVWFEIPYVFGASLTLVGMTWDGTFDAGGPRAGLPGTMPTISLRTLDATTGAAATVGTATDASINVAAYELPHEVTLAVAPQVFTPTTVYGLRVTGEAGVNALALSAILRLYATIAAV